MTMTTETTQTDIQIRQLIEAHTQAICTKNLDQIMAHYAADIVIFDLKPPLILKGIDACRHLWETGLPCMSDLAGMEQQELNVTIDGHLAVAYWIFRFTGLKPDHPAAQIWLRITAVCQRQQDDWQIVHEHVSMPFAPENSGDRAQL